MGRGEGWRGGGIRDGLVSTFVLFDNVFDNVVEDVVEQEVALLAARYLLHDFTLVAPLSHGVLVEQSVVLPVAVVATAFYLGLGH